MKNIVIGTAGHIDHGKSTLVKALTGVDPDRLKEEKERGITIDLGFANLQLSDAVRVAFVDVPGHERFVKNMLAGVGGIDAVVLVVAANESLMPQTREHFDICRLLNIQRGIVVITKCDLVEPEIVELVRLELQDHLRDSFLEKAPIIPFSAADYSGLIPLKLSLEELAGSISGRSVDLPFRLPVDRCFSLRGFGTVATGTLVSGTIKKGDEVELYPSGKQTRVRHIQVHSEEVDQAVAGQRTALNLQGMEVCEVQRGLQLSVCNQYRVISTFDSRVILLDSSSVSLKNQTRVRLHLGTAELLARLSPIHPKVISPGHTGMARLVLENPVLALVGDRFILRRISPMTTIGGGVVLDIMPPRRKNERDVNQRIKFLQTIESEDPKAIIGQLVKRNATQGSTEDQILSQVPLSRRVVREVLSELLKGKQLWQLAENPLQVMDSEWFSTLGRRSLALIKNYQEQEPLVSGMSREQLHSAIFSDTAQAAFRSVLTYLCEEQLVELDQDRVRLKGEGVRLSASEVEALHKIEDVFRKAGLKVPSVEEVLREILISKNQARRLLVLLNREKKLVKVAESLYFHVDSIEELKRKLYDYKKQNDQIDVPTFKNLANISRKYAIPLLEYLDRERVTRRVGKVRLIVQEHLES